MHRYRHYLHLAVHNLPPGNSPGWHSGCIQTCLMLSGTCCTLTTSRLGVGNGDYQFPIATHPPNLLPVHQDRLLNPQWITVLRFGFCRHPSLIPQSQSTVRSPEDFLDVDPRVLIWIAMVHINHTITKVAHIVLENIDIELSHQPPPETHIVVDVGVKIDTSGYPAFFLPERWNKPNQVFILCGVISGELDVHSLRELSQQSPCKCKWSWDLLLQRGSLTCTKRPNAFIIKRKQSATVWRYSLSYYYDA